MRRSLQRRRLIEHAHIRGLGTTLLVSVAAPATLRARGSWPRNASGIARRPGCVSSRLASYLVVWSGFSAVATLAQWGLHSAALLSAMMVSTSPILGGILLVAAGAYQWTPLKRACLVRCRSPLAFLLAEWRDGPRGAFLMGLRHGVYCLGCCWILMALLFVAGVMNLLWVATLAAFVLVEKVLPRGDLAGRLAGAVLILAGFILLAR